MPLADLHLKPKSTGDLRGDVGVIFADESGKGRSMRLYYYNHHTEMIDDLATEATLQPNEWGKIAMPMGPNLVRNGGFEEPLVDSKDDVDKGWYVNVTRNGNGASLSSKSPYSGHQALLLEASVAVSFPPEAYAYPDNTAFLKAANGGKGYGEVEVRQRVVVTGGHRYSVRFRFRSQDYPGECRTPGHPRGYVAFSSRIEWTCPPPNRGARTSLASSYDTCSILGPVLDWYTVHDAQTFAPPAPYAAPKGATAADIVFYMRNVTDSLPRFLHRRCRSCGRDVAAGSNADAWLEQKPDSFLWHCLSVSQRCHGITGKLPRIGAHSPTARHRPPFYEEVCRAARRRSGSFKSTFRRRICVGVTSTHSSSAMNSNASSSDIRRAGFKRMLRSWPTARMLLSFFSLVGLTFMSSGRLFSPTIIPS